MKAKSGADWPQLWKRNAVVAVIALFVCAAVYLNWNYEQETNVGKTLGESSMVNGKGDPLLIEDSTETGTEIEDTTQQMNGTGYFAMARLNRQQARDSALTILQDSSEGETNPAMMEETNQAIQTMADYTVTEAQIENLVLAKGYADCVAFIGDGSLSLVVAAPEHGLTQADTARIVDVVNQVSQFSTDQIKIIEVE